MKSKKCSNTSRLLAYATRIVFLLLVLLSASQITYTIIFMLICRRNTRDLVLTLDLSVDPCQGQGIPAYIAFLILLVTIFGFGCVGRKATSMILCLLGICDIAMSIYFEILESNKDFSRIRWDLNQTANLCYGKVNYTPSSNPNLTDSNLKTCHEIFEILYGICPETKLDDNAIENCQIMQNCSNTIITSLKDIKFKYHHISLPMTLVSSIMYTILSVVLFYIQFRDKRLPGYRRREHILHMPEFKECPTKEEETEDMGARWTLKLCLLSILWCQCRFIFGKKYCCGRRHSTRSKHDAYEFEALPTRLNHDDPTASITNLV